MKVLLIWPKIPATFWSYKHALPFISKTAVEPPLGLLTVAAMLPDPWEKRLLDMNVTQLNDPDILWADYVFLSAMNIQRDSFLKIVKMCNRLGAKVIAGGPMVTTDHPTLHGIDHFVLNEAEITLPLFLEDLENGNPKHVYRTDEFADITKTPVPQWELLEMERYAMMDIQYSRGCPHNCEFCSITTYLGRRCRIKSTDQFLKELTHLYSLGWQGNVFIVDDNFIGSRKILKNELLPALATWLKEHNYPFRFHTEVTIDLADDQELMTLMVNAGVSMVFIGIETPDDGSLAECGKRQNRGRNMLHAIYRILKNGMMVTGGFIVGFDSDPPDIFEKQIRFIQKSGIVTAMVGLLHALPGTQLFKRLQRENRIVFGSSGNNTDGSLNFIPAMNKETLLDGYRNLVSTIYSKKEIFQRIKKTVLEYRLPPIPSPRQTLRDIRAFWRAMLRLGILERGRTLFWRLLFFVLKEDPRKLPMAVTLAISGFHFNRVSRTA